MPVETPGYTNEIMPKCKGFHTTLVAGLQTLQTFSVSKGEQIQRRKKKIRQPQLI